MEYVECPENHRTPCVGSKEREDNNFKGSGRISRNQERKREKEVGKKKGKEGGREGGRKEGRKQNFGGLGWRGKWGFIRKESGSKITRFNSECSPRLMSTSFSGNILL